MVKKCICGGELVNKKVEFKLYGISLGKFDADVCVKCGEEWFDEKTSNEMDEIAKKKGLWGLSGRTKITRTGNSLAVRIPHAIVKFLKLKEGEEADIHPEDGKLVIETS